MKRLVAGLLTLVCAGCGEQPRTEPDNEMFVPSGAASTSGGTEPGKLYVTTQRVQRRTCPNVRCGDVGWAAFRQTLEPLERRDGWVRITKFYEGACENGQSKYVDSGNKACTTDNGFKDGQFAEWVRESAVSATRPADPAESARADEGIVAQSDDFKEYHASFARVAHRLIEEGRCTAADFEEQGGWMKSVNEHKDEPVYFTYCGGMTSVNKIYMNAETGATL